MRSYLPLFLAAFAASAPALATEVVPVPAFGSIARRRRGVDQARARPTRHHRRGQLADHAVPRRTRRQAPHRRLRRQLPAPISPPHRHPEPFGARRGDCRRRLDPSLRRVSGPAPAVGGGHGRWQDRHARGFGGQRECSCPWRRADLGAAALKPLGGGKRGRAGPLCRQPDGLQRDQRRRLRPPN